MVKVGDRALGLHEGVLGEGRLIVLGDHVLGPRDRAVRVAALQALVGQDVAAAVDKRRALLHSRMRVKNRRLDVILHPDELFGLLDGLQALAAHEGDGVAQVMRVAENRDQGVPVMLDVADLVFARDVGRRHHAHDARHLFGRARVDGAHDRARVGSPDSRAVEHAGQVNVVGVHAGAQHLLAHVDAVHMLAAHAGDRRNVGDLAAAPLDLGRDLDRVDDLLVARAAAIVVAQGKGDLVAGRIQVLVQKCLGAQHHARDAEAALHGAGLAEGIDIELLLVVGQALDRLHGLAVHARQLLHAALGWLAVDQHRAGAAGTLRAAVLDRLEPQLMPEHVHQALVGLRGVGYAVDRQGIHDGIHLIFFRAMYCPHPVRRSAPPCTAWMPRRNTSRTEPAVRKPSNGV